MLETRGEQMGWEEPTRDSLVQIGAGFFMSGLYLVMMGSDTKDGDEAKAASFHKETSNCGRCGHKQCTGEVLCIDTPDTEQATATRKKDCFCKGVWIWLDSDLSCAYWNLACQWRIRKMTRVIEFKLDSKILLCKAGARKASSKQTFNYGS